jgi:flagellar biosynthesis/type III secretory pathway protein FliH
MASIVKANQPQAASNTPPTAHFNFEDVTTRAREYLDAVRQQAAELLEETQRECERLRAQAVADGHKMAQQTAAQDSEEKANELAAHQVALAMKHVEQLGQSLEDATGRWLHQWQHETIPLAIEIAEKLVCRQIEIEPQILIDWITQTVRLVQSSRSIQIRLHPQVIKTLGPSLDQLVQQLSHNMAVEVIADESIQRPGAVIQTPDGKLDAQLRTQLARLSEELN